MLSPTPPCHTEHPGEQCGALLAGLLPPHRRGWILHPFGAFYGDFMVPLHGAMAKWPHAAPSSSSAVLAPLAGAACLSPTAIVCAGTYPWGAPHGSLQPLSGGSGCPGRAAPPFSFAKEPRGGTPACRNRGNQGQATAPLYPPSRRLSRQRGDAGFWAWACRGGRGRAGSQPFPSPGNSPGRLPWALFFFFFRA